MEVEIIMDASESKGGWGEKREEKKRNSLHNLWTKDSAAT